MFYEGYCILKMTLMFLFIGLVLRKVIFNGKVLDLKYEYVYRRREKW